MRCYLTGKPCSCQLDDIAEEGCDLDVDRDRSEFTDPFRAGEIGLCPDLVYLNGLANDFNASDI